MLPTGYPEPFERLRLQSKPQYNMGASSDNAPVNQGGPGNPGGANNLARLPRFFGGQNTKPPALERSQYPTHPAFPTPQLPSPDNWTRPMQPGTGGQNGQRPPGMGLPPFRQQPREDMFQPQYPMQSQDPYNIYGAAGQSPQLGRYRPPMMENAENPQDWMGGAGGYSYNIPNSYGSGQWNQFNSTDRPFPRFGQAQPPQFGGTQQGTYDPRTNRYYGGPVQQQPQGNPWLAGLFGFSNPYQMQAPQPIPQPQAQQPPNATMPGVPGDGLPPG